MKKVIAYVISGIIFMFFILWGLLDFIIIPSTWESNITNSEWITFIATYSAGTLGGLIAILGIGWQLNHEKKEKTKRVKKYINFIINKNLKIEKLIDSEILISYNKPLFGNVNKQEKIKLLIEFDQNYFDGNIDDIISLDNGEEIIELNNNVIALNNIYNRNFSNALDKHNLLIKKNEEVIQIIKLYSDVLDNFRSEDIFTLSRYLDLFLKKLKTNFLETPGLINLNELITYIEVQLEKFQILKDLQIKVMGKRFNEMLESPSTEYKEVSDDIGKLDYLERLKIITTLSEKTINYLIDKNFIVTKSQLDKDMLLSLYDDRNTNGRALQIYKDLRKISADLK